MKKITIVITVVILLLVGWALYSTTRVPVNSIKVSSFDECVNAGFPIMESYPRKCKDSNGITFTETIKEQLSYVNATVDLIKINSPIPGDKVANNFTISGSARGTWYFEASFPVVITSANGTILFQGPAQAQSDWMTSDFVPFKIDIKLPASYVGPATITLKKDNPSGLSEKDASVYFSVNVGN